MPHLKFDISKLERLNDPERLTDLRPDVMWEALGSPTPGTVVDIGAGTGLFSCTFAGYAPDAIFFAADTEPTAVRWMLEHRPASLCGRLNPVLARETAVPLPTGEADLILMINLHHELADPSASYREALRLTKIGGQLLVADWAPRETPKGPPLHVRVTAEEIAEVARQVGWGDIIVHDGLPHHSLLTARKPTVCAL